MKENDLVEAKAEHEKALDLTGPRCGWLIGERSMKRERLPPPRSPGGGHELGTREVMRSLSCKLAVRLRNYDEANPAESVEFLSKVTRARDRRMEDELSVAEPKHCHPNRDRNQAGRPTDLILGAPEIRVVLD